jgi:hypothetical protein
VKAVSGGRTTTCGEWFAGCWHGWHWVRGANNRGRLSSVARSPLSGSHATDCALPVSYTQQGKAGELVPPRPKLGSPSQGATTAITVHRFAVNDSARSRTGLAVALFGLVSHLTISFESAEHHGLLPVTNKPVVPTFMPSRSEFDLAATSLPESKRVIRNLRITQKRISDPTRNRDAQKCQKNSVQGTHRPDIHRRN